MARMINCAQSLTPPPFSVVVGLLAAVCGAAVKVEVHKRESRRLASRMCALHPLLMKALEKNIPDKEGICANMSCTLEDCARLLNKFAPPAASRASGWSAGKRFCQWAKSVFVSVTLDTKEFEACHQAVDRVLLEFNFLVQVNIEPSPSAQEISDEARKSLEDVLALSTKMIMDSMMATVASDIQDEMRAMKSDLQSCLMEQLKQLDAKVDKVLIEVQGISAMFRNEVASEVNRTSDRTGGSRDSRI